MTDTVRPGSDEARPDPAHTRTPAEFVDAMFRLKQWTGWGFRRLEKRATAAGHVLPRSTLTVALTRRTLPREDLIAAFTVACGCDEAETARWIASRRRIASAPVAPDLEPPTDSTVAPVAAPASARAPETQWRTRRVGWRARRIIALAAAAGTLAAAAAIGGYILLRPDDPSAPAPGSGQAAPARPDSSRPPSAPESSTSTTEPTTTPTTAAPPAAVTPAAEVVVAQSAPAQPPAPGSPPANAVTPPPAPEETFGDVIQTPGEPTIYCPRPYLSTRYAALAQCTQVSGDQARPGYYSPYNHQFSPTTGWMTIDNQRWYAADAPATDGVRAQARGYAIVKTIYGGAVYATQYRDGEARWGIINVIDGQFRPASQGWQPVGP